MLVNYRGLPKHTPANLFPCSETVGQALENLRTFSEVPLATTFFLASIAQYEGFLRHNVVLTPPKKRPMMGDLQKAADQNPGRPIEAQTMVQNNEVRERRNVLIHRGGVADEQYIKSAVMAHPLSDGAVALVASGTVVEVTPAYFTYATKVLIDYCRQVAGLNA